MHRRLPLLIAVIITVTLPPSIGAHPASRRVTLVLRNAPPADSAAAIAVLRAALERDSTVTVVGPPNADDLKARRYPGAQWYLEATYRKDRDGERLELFIANVETGVIVRRDTVRHEGNARVLWVPPRPIATRPAARPLLANAVGLR